MSKRLEALGWVCTDPDCNQHRKTITEGKLYSFFEDRIIDPTTGETERHSANIDLRDYTEEEIEDTLATYGYKYKDGKITDQTGTTWEDPALIAECMFEMDM